MCKWSVDLGSGAPLLLLAGQKGLIRVLDCGRGALVHVRGVGGGGAHPVAAGWTEGPHPGAGLRQGRAGACERGEDFSLVCCRYSVS